MADIRFERATRIYPGTDTPAVDALDLHIADAELMVLVGPSGSGKSTALRMLAGLEDVDDGGIWIGDRDVTYVRPRDRDERHARGEEDQHDADRTARPCGVHPVKVPEWRSGPGPVRTRSRSGCPPVRSGR